MDQFVLSTTPPDLAWLPMKLLSNQEDLDLTNDEVKEAADSIVASMRDIAMSTKKSLQTVDSKVVHDKVKAAKSRSSIATSKFVGEVIVDTIAILQALLTEVPQLVKDIVGYLHSRDTKDPIPVHYIDDDSRARLMATMPSVITGSRNLTFVSSLLADPPERVKQHGVTIRGDHDGDGLPPRVEKKPKIGSDTRTWTPLIKGKFDLTGNLERANIAKCSLSYELDGGVAVLTKSLGDGTFVWSIKVDKVNFGDIKLYFVTADNAVLSVDNAEGKEVWKINFQSMQCKNEKPPKELGENIVMLPSTNV